MLTRRSLLQSLGVSPVALNTDGSFSSRRPPLAQRKFKSEAVEATISDVKRHIADPELGWLFENCFPNTLDTTVRTGLIGGKPDTFVVTGDINAMWLRDSTAQVWPYLPLTKNDRKLKDLIEGVVRRQTRCILIDPYANAFNFGPTGSEWAKDVTTMKPELHERKWEIDSLCYPVRLAHGFWKQTGDESVFDTQWQQSAHLIVKTFRVQQRLNGPGPYHFQRLTEAPGDTLPQGGYGNPTRPCGLIHSGFRPSDDACIFPLLIPSNLFAVTALTQLAEIFSSVLHDEPATRECTEFAGQLQEALGKYAAASKPKHGEIYAYELDGFGNQLFQDDANVPSLLSLPYLDCVKRDDPLYQRTRQFVLSEDNPYFYRGKAASGLGGPHSGLNMIWPLGIITRALTSDDDTEIASCIAILKATHAGTGFMHESFNKDDATKFTRTWFAWANTLFGELILSVYQKKPRLLG